MIIAYDAKRLFHNSSGLGNYSRDLVRIMASYFPENWLFLLNKKSSERGKDILSFPNVEFIEVSKGIMARQLNMGKKAQEIRADIFHGLSGELPLKWLNQDIKKVVTIHDLIFERYPQFYSFFDRKIHFWKFKKAAEIADKVIAISEQTKKDIIQFLNIPEEKIEVIYQGCHQAFKEIPNKAFIKEVKEKFQIPDRFILNVGTIEERKNLHTVIKALAGTKIPLVVVGKKTQYYKTVAREIEKNKVQVLFLEGISMHELAVLYRLADIFVYPSLFEGFGIPVIEALFSETVVVTSNTSCLPEAGGPDSVYVNPTDSRDIRVKLLYLWENAAERQRRAEKGRIFVQKFRDDIIAHNLHTLYESLFQ